MLNVEFEFEFEFEKERKREKVKERERERKREREISSTDIFPLENSPSIIFGHKYLVDMFRQ